MTELPNLLEDPARREAMKQVAYLPEKFPEMVTLRLMEMVGTYVKHGLLEDQIIFDYWYPAIVHAWERLDDLGVIAIHRGSAGPTIWENYEDLYHRARRWIAVHDPTVEPRAWSDRPTAPIAEPARTKS